MAIVVILVLLVLLGLAIQYWFVAVPLAVVGGIAWYLTKQADNKKLQL
jgi:hypothetical protein